MVCVVKDEVCCLIDWCCVCVGCWIWFGIGMNGKCGKIWSVGGYFYFF